MDLLPQLLFNSLVTGSIYALASIGLSLVYGIQGVLNFAHGHLMMAGAYFFYLFYIQFDLGIAPSSLGTLILTLITAYISMKIFVKPFTRFHMMLPFVTTLALGTLLEAGVSMVFGVNVKSLSKGYGIESIEFGSIYMTELQIFIIASAILLLSFIAFIIHSTSIGRIIRSIASHRPAAQALGFRKSKVELYVFMAGVLTAAYAGILVGFETNLQPTMGNAYTIKAFAAMILGGLGNMWGTLIGAFLLGLIENLSIGLDFGSFSIPAGYKDAFSFLVILLVLLFRPQGLLGQKKRST